MIETVLTRKIELKTCFHIVNNIYYLIFKFLEFVPKTGLTWKWSWRIKPRQIGLRRMRWTRYDVFSSIFSIWDAFVSVGLHFHADLFVNFVFYFKFKNLIGVQCDLLGWPTSGGRFPEVRFRFCCQLLNFHFWITDDHPGITRDSVQRPAGSRGKPKQSYGYVSSQLKLERQLAQRPSLVGGPRPWRLFATVSNEN